MQDLDLNHEHPTTNQICEFGSEGEKRTAFLRRHSNSVPHRNRFNFKREKK